MRVLRPSSRTALKEEEFQGIACFLAFECHCESDMFEEDLDL